MAQTQPPGGVRRVLVIDDSDDVSSSTADVLRLGGYDACVAKDVDDAVAILNEGNVALILLDYGVPDGKGMALLDRFTGLPPVVLMSASAEAPVVDPRVCAFLPKPCHPHDLLDEVALRLTLLD